MYVFEYGTDEAMQGVAAIIDVNINPKPEDTCPAIIYSATLYKIGIMWSDMHQNEVRKRQAHKGRTHTKPDSKKTLRHLRILDLLYPPIKQL